MLSEAKNNLARSYNEDAYRRSQSNPSEWKLQERENFMNVLRDEGKKNLLEIGSGTGKDAKVFSDQGYEVTCIDLSSEMIRFCKEQGLHAKVMDFYELEFLDDSFDAVYALNCLLHVPNDDMEKVLKEIKRVLKPDGVFYLGLYGGKDTEGIWEEDWCDPKRFFAFRSEETIQSIVKNDFDLFDYPVCSGTPINTNECLV
ncbi:class I SAM-dependent methyltransferase [Paenibacillus filicis]|uniref:Class I SAM-dependent methyltransferase n=1 Tax=Paenibacillus gyeongsangnamensis TaxID=3388067 RepID=A0ABT4QL73_9BACL|nr:class I SAM-dependent methyltransferase [Paenibacillus filicis]MCZ8517621.1 class I SAM-dependent methyltransferase [Paenibacillus filicis]